MEFPWDHGHSESLKESDATVGEIMTTSHEPSQFFVGCESHCEQPANFFWIMCFTTWYILTYIYAFIYNLFKFCLWLQSEFKVYCFINMWMCWCEIHKLGNTQYYIRQINTNMYSITHRYTSVCQSVIFILQSADSVVLLDHSLCI